MWTARPLTRDFKLFSNINGRKTFPYQTSKQLYLQLNYRQHITLEYCVFRSNPNTYYSPTQKGRKLAMLLQVTERDIKHFGFKYTNVMDVNKLRTISCFRTRYYEMRRAVINRESRPLWIFVSRAFILDGQ